MRWVLPLLYTPLLLCRLAHLPHYRDAHDVIAHTASYVLPQHSTIADLGCSTGYAIANIAQALRHRTITAHGYDLDQSMLDAATERLATCPNTQFTPHHHDLTTTPLDHPPAHLTLLLWTLQFIPADTWTNILRAAHQAAHPDGILIVSAKTRLPDSRWQDIADGALIDWKAASGLDPETILTKAHALRGVMLQAPTDRITHHITSAGWTPPTILYQWHNWAILASHAR